MPPQSYQKVAKQRILSDESWQKKFEKSVTMARFGGAISIG